MKKRKFTAFIFAFKRIEVFYCIAACYTEITGKGYAVYFVFRNRCIVSAKLIAFRRKRNPPRRAPDYWI